MRHVGTSFLTLLVTILGRKHLEKETINTSLIHRIDRYGAWGLCP